MSERPTESPSVWETAAGLFARWRDGEPGALDDLVRLLSPMLWQVSRASGLDRTAAEDVVQTTWLRAFEHLGEVRDPERVSSWLVTIARRECLKLMRSGKREVPGLEQQAEQRDERSPHPEKAAVDARMNDLLWQHVNSLPASSRALVVALSSNEAPAYPETFGFQVDDATGHGCPVGSHIRRANPRDSRPVDPNSKAQTGGEAGLEATLALRHRMLRRGIPYGTPLSFSAADHGDTTGLDEERGLLFVALVGDLRRQFEFVQAHWMADGNAFRLGADRDLFAGAGEEGNKFVVQGTPPAFVRPPRPLVTCRGGEYFFLPGIRALKLIAAGG